MKQSSAAIVEKSTIDESLSALKIMASFLLHQLRHTDEIALREETSQGATFIYKDSQVCKGSEEVYEFSFSCILAGIIAISQHLKVVTPSIQGHEFIPTQSQTKFLKCANALSSGFTWLALIMKYANRIADRISSSCDRLAFKSNYLPLKFYQKTLQLVEPVAVACIRVIIRSMHSSTSIEACLRSCLTVIRSSVMVAHSYKRLSSHENKQKLKEKDACPNGSTDFSDIDDEAFMSIDLDALQFDSISRGEIWSLLFQLLQQSQVRSCILSVRYFSG